MGKRLTAAAALLAFALVGVGCSHAPTDAQLAARVKTQISKDTQLKETSLNVVVRKGVATITGRVPSVSARYEAFRLTAETPGIKKVNDQMTVQEAMLTSPTANSPPRSPRARQPREPRQHHPRHVVLQTQPGSPSASPQPEPPSASPSTLPGYPVSSPSSSTLSSPPGPAPASASVPSSPSQPVAAPPPPPVERITIPQGTQVNIRMVDSIDSAQNRTGDIFHATLADPIKIRENLVAPRGADVYVRLVEARSAGHFSGRSELRLELYRLVVDGKSYPLVSNDYDLKGPNRTKRSALAIIGGAALGAAIGAIAGGGKGAAIGAAAGGGGGAVYQGATKTAQVRIDSETLLHFKLEQAVAVSLTPAPSSAPDANP